MDQVRCLLANNGVLGHDREVGTSDNVTVTGGGNEDISTSSSLLHGGNLISSHSSLKSVDGVDLSDDDTGTVRPQGLGALLPI